jgi:hypothetical protein
MNPKYRNQNSADLAVARHAENVRGQRKPTLYRMRALLTTEELRERQDTVKLLSRSGTCEVVRMH